MKNPFLFILFCLSSVTFFAQDLTQEETNLYNLIMQYRAEKGLPSIPLSTSLTFVAKTHARDLANYSPDKGNCNMHSWSRNGDWTSCCYTRDHAKAKCMWTKPQELTNYTGYGYEIAYWTSETATPRGALASWKTSSGHNGVIINKGIWKTHPWQAIGIGMYKGYAVVWFGEEKDVK
jgi:uncharacterized protein YkwD